MKEDKLLVSRTDLDRLSRRVLTVGFVTALPLFFVLSFISAVIFFRFDARMIGLFWAGYAICVAVLVIPYLLVLRASYTPVKRLLLRALDESPGSETSPNSRELRALEAFPLIMGVFSFATLALGLVLCVLLFYFLAEYNAWLCVYYYAMSAVIALICGYLAVYIIYAMMEPARRLVYSRYGLSRDARGMTLKGRLWAMAGVFALIPITAAFVIAVTFYIFETHNNVKQQGAHNAGTIAGWVDEPSGDDEIDYSLPADRSGSLALTADETWLLLDGDGEVVEEESVGKGVDREEIPAMLEDLGLLEEGDEPAVLNQRMTMVAAAAPVGGSGYTVVEILPLAPFQESTGLLFSLYLLLFGLALAYAAVTAYLILSSILVPLRKLEEASGAVAEGDLTVRISVSAADEVGNVTGSFGAMVNNLHIMSTNSLQAAEETSDSATGVSATAEEFQASLEQLTGVIEGLAENASSESKMAERVYALIGEIHQALEASSGQADEGAGVSHTSSELAEEGRKDALAAMERMGSVSESIGETAGIIGTLDEQVSEIGVIVEVIDNIADQTNLLSLNAAIEAARAQEHGRGFAVVAEEVKKLAEESARSTSRIAALVRDIQRNTGLAVSATQKGAEEVDSGVQAVRVAGDSLEKIYEYVKRAEEISRGVAETTRRHLELIEKGTGAMEQIRGIAEQNASSSEEIAAAAEEQSASMQELASTSQQLASMAEHLKEIASSYKL